MCFVVRPNNKTQSLNSAFLTERSDSGFLVGSWPAAS